MSESTDKKSSLRGWVSSLFQGNDKAKDANAKPETKVRTAEQKARGEHDKNRGPRGEHRGPRTEARGENRGTHRGGRPEARGEQRPHGKQARPGERSERPERGERPRGHKPQGPRPHQGSRPQQAQHAKPKQEPRPSHKAPAVPPPPHAIAAQNTFEGGGPFAEMGLVEPLLRAIHDVGYTDPTPIQQAAIPHLLAGKDLLGCAQTGTGKTAAFALPILQRLSQSSRRARPKQCRALILTPTRELAIQIYDNFRDYGKNLLLRPAVIFGGVGQAPQVKALEQGLDVLVATPGRLLDLINQRHASLEGLEIFVLDEADRMLDMGFIHDIRKILKLLPEERHNLFFSATMPPEIQTLANTILRNPEHVAVAPVASTAELIQQSLMFVDKADKRELLKHVLKDERLNRVIVFTRTKHGANRVAETLDKTGISSAAIHGNKSQGARQKALEDFRVGRVRVLVATDIAARGIDIDDISHVINFEIPNVPESYVHRIGRTARAGAEGIAISFCDAEEKEFVRDIEKLIKQEIPVTADQPYHSEKIATMTIGRGGGPRPQGGGRPQNRGGGRGGGGRGGGRGHRPRR